MRDLGLTYEQAAHGVQSAIKFRMGRDGIDTDAGPALNELKHHRVGIDCRAADARGLAELLIAKGVFTLAEYVEYMRLAMNEELAMHEGALREAYGPSITLGFR